jgi:hypothetical protein
MQGLDQYCWFSFFCNVEVSSVEILILFYSMLFFVRLE